MAEVYTHSSACTMVSSFRKDQALTAIIERIEASGDSADQMVQKIVAKESVPYTIAQQIIDT
ncbi:MAG TPA: hypothetical protein VEF34_12745 [Syntrophobacteraceae bacterium]|nr:hypothetical protein [Syntrophobacteraceae bacterium]